MKTTAYKSNSVKQNTENQALSCDLSNLKAAAEWLALHRHEFKRALIPVIREHFPLTMLEAIEAIKLAGTLARTKYEVDQSHG